MSPIKGGTAAKTLTALIVFVFIALVFSQAGKKFVLDELDFPVVAKATSESWRPVYYRGEEAPQHLGLYHPPLYIYALAAHIKIFGFSENAVRSFGLLCTLLTALLTGGIASRLMDRGKLWFFIPIFCGLYLLNPYTIANTTLPDIDQTILPPLITLFILLLFNERTSNRSLGLVFAVLLWAKLTTPLVLVPFAFVYWLLQTRSPKQVVVRSFSVFGGGALFFLASYWLYCKAVNLPFRYTFEFLAHSFTKGGDGHGFQAFFAKIQQNFSNAPELVRWMTAPFLFLFVAGATDLLLRRGEPEKAKALLLAGLAAFIAVFYSGLISPFGGFFKYPFPAFQFACLTVAFAVCTRIKNGPHLPGPNALLLITAFALAATVVQTVFWRDQPTMGLAWSARNLAIGALLSGVAFGALIACRAREQKILVGALSTVVGVTIGMGLGVSRTQAISPLPTKYYYGQQGMDETVSYLKNSLRPGEVVWSMKDVGFYTGNRYSESYRDFFEKDGKERVIALSKSGVRFFVATKGIGEDRIDVYSDIQEALDECCTLVKNFGNYYIYKAGR